MIDTTQIVQNVMPSTESLISDYRKLGHHNFFVNLHHHGMETYKKWYSPSLSGLDAFVMAHVTEDTPWFFFEAGANDGLSQSNSFVLETVYHWDGILVEPINKKYNLCRELRRAKALNTALVGDSNQTTVLGSFSDEMPGSSLMAGCTDLHLDNQAYLSEVPAMTIDSILDQCKPPNGVGIMFLDVEGFENEVIKGLSLESHRPEIICIEIAKHNIAEVTSYFKNKNYELVDYRDKDFIFKDKK